MSSDRQATSSQHQRRICRFSGHVQGVGFRYTSQDIAGRFEIRGYVRNLPDGSVELIAEGAPRELDGFIHAIRDRMGDFIREVQQSSQPATGEFTSFSIRH